MSKRHLSLAERQQLWTATSEAFNENRGRSVAFIRRQARKKLAGFGWEEILISLAVKFITELILKWIENKFHLAPQNAPAGFASGPLPELPDPEDEAE